MSNQVSFHTNTDRLFAGIASYSQPAEDAFSSHPHNVRLRQAREAYDSYQGPDRSVVVVAIRCGVERRDQENMETFAERVEDAARQYVLAGLG